MDGQSGMRGDVETYRQHMEETVIAGDLRFKTATLDRVLAGGNEESHARVGIGFRKSVCDGGRVVGLCSVIRSAKRDAQWCDRLARERNRRGFVAIVSA